MQSRLLLLSVGTALGRRPARARPGLQGDGRLGVGEGSRTSLLNISVGAEKSRQRGHTHRLWTASLARNSSSQGEGRQRLTQTRSPWGSQSGTRSPKCIPTLPWTQGLCSRDRAGQAVIGARWTTHSFIHPSIPLFHALRRSVVDLLGFPEGSQGHQPRGRRRVRNSVTQARGRRQGRGL